MTRATEVASGIYRIEAPFGERFVCVFLLRGSERTVLVDTGLASTPAEVIVPALADAGVSAERLDLVVISHADLDHSGGDRAVRDLAPRALFAAHAADCALIEDVELMLSDRYGEVAETDGIDETDEAKAWTRENAADAPIDLRLQGEATLALGAGDEVSILHTPGHSHGHLTLWRARDRVAIIADAVLGDAIPTVDGKPAFAPTYRYLREYEGTIERLRGLQPEVLLTSHFPVMVGAAAGEFIDRSLGFVRRVDDAVRQALVSDGERTMRSLIDELSPQLGSWPEETRDALRFPLVGHLEELVASGDVIVEHSGDVRTFRWHRT